MRYQNEQVNQYFVSGTEDLKVLEQDVDSKELKCFINYIPVI